MEAYIRTAVIPYDILRENNALAKSVYYVTELTIWETYSRVRLGKHLSDVFLIRNGLKQGDDLSPLFFNFALEYAIRRV